LNRWVSLDGDSAPRVVPAKALEPARRASQLVSRSTPLQSPLAPPPRCSISRGPPDRAKKNPYQQSSITATVLASEYHGVLAKAPTLRKSQEQAWLSGYCLALSRPTQSGTNRQWTSFVHEGVQIPSWKLVTPVGVDVPLQHSTSSSQPSTHPSSLFPAPSPRPPNPKAERIDDRQVLPNQSAKCQNGQVLSYS